uniref:Uncharacterized protein n=1 Tax=Aegilops tauschii subsp. strangulata TaxID=200361 RepID=A0A453IQK0_AEGTS
MPRNGRVTNPEPFLSKSRSCASRWRRRRRPRLDRPPAACRSQEQTTTMASRRPSPASTTTTTTTATWSRCCLPAWPSAGGSARSGGRPCRASRKGETEAEYTTADQTHGSVSLCVYVCVKCTQAVPAGGRVA